MRVAFDECIPHDLLEVMPETWSVSVVRRLGLTSSDDGSLLDQFEREDDVLVTLDKGIPFQNDLRKRRIGFVRIDLKRNTFPTIASHLDRLIAVIAEAPGRSLTLTLTLTREGVTEMVRDEVDPGGLRDIGSIRTDLP